MIPILLAATALAGATDEAAVRRYALLVGANDGGEYRVRLRYAHADARAMGGVLTDLGGVHPEDRFALYDPDGTALARALDDLSASVAGADGARTQVVFYYSGHSDETGLLLGEDRFDWSELRSRLEGMPADIKVAIVDSCASGALVRGKGGRRVAPFLMDESRDVAGHAFITSSSADEMAQEADRIAGSFFTYTMVTGLRGAADTSGDGRVTLDEAYEYAFNGTLEITSETQHGAQHAYRDFQLVGAGGLVLTDLTRTSATLVFDEQLEGRAYVRDADGHLVAELFKPAGRPISLGLAPGRYTITLTLDGRYGRAALELEEDGQVRLTPGALLWSEGEVAVARGGTVELRPVPARVQLLTLQPSHVADHLTFNVLMGRSGTLEGAAVGFGVNVVEGEARGGMLGMAANITGGDLRGTQLSMGYNHVGGDGGGQISIGGNVTEGHVRGGQLAVGFNVAGGEMQGAQAAVGFNAAADPVHGVQAAVGVNIAARSLHGAQLSSGLNVAGGIKGAQIGIVNVGGDVNGAQIGIVNVGVHVRGAQIGLVNISDRIDGVPLGLVSVSRHGRFDLTLFWDATTRYNADLKMGSHSVYTTFGIGYDPGRHMYAGLGLGGHIPAGPLFFDIDAGGYAYQASDKLWAGTHEAMVVRARLTVGLDIHEFFAPVVGASFNYRIPITSEDVDIAPPMFVDEDLGDVVAWPSVFVGIQF